MKQEKIVTLSDREHLLQRSGMWAGSIKKNPISDFILENNKFVKKDFEYVPAFITTFKEVITNSIDEYIKTNGQYSTKIKIELTDDFISIEDNGRGISSELVEGTDTPASVAVFTKLKTGSNFSNDSQSLGQNGVGAKLAMVYSRKFIADTCTNGKRTLLTCTDNGKNVDYKISDKEGNYTKIKYFPDFERFSLTKLDEIHKQTIIKTIIDYAVCFPKISFIVNKKKITSNTFKKYCELYDSNVEVFSFENIDIGIYSGDYSQISFVNGHKTTRGGTHVDLLVNKITYPLRELIAKKYKEIKPLDIKNKFCFILNFRNFEAPRFDSQTKEHLINVQKEILSLFSDIDFEVLAKKLKKNDELLFPIIETFKIKEELKKRKELKSKEKKVAKKKIAKLIDADQKSSDKILFLAEGNSALSRFIEVRNKNEGGYPLRGKVISPQDTPLDKLMKNSEIQDILAALNLKLSSPDISEMSYDKIAIMTDADEDGSAIGCTLINLFYTFWPDIVKQEKLVWAISPIIIAKDKKENKIVEFFSLQEYQNYINYSYLEIKEHLKGLGSLDSKQYRKMLDTHVEITEDDLARTTLDMAYGKDSSPRKIWLME